MPPDSERCAGGIDVVGVQSTAMVCLVGTLQLDRRKARQRGFELAFPAGDSTSGAPAVERDASGSNDAAASPESACDGACAAMSRDGAATAECAPALASGIAASSLPSLLAIPRRAPLR